MEDFSARLKRLMLQRGMSQAMLAERAQTTEATVSRYMASIHKPSLEVIMKIAKALDVSMDYLVGLTDKKELYREQAKDVIILVNAYDQADDEHRDIIWSVLNTYLKPEEKACLDAIRQEKSKLDELA